MDPVTADTLDIDALSRLLDSSRDRLPAMLADIERLVRVESPSADHAAVAAGAAVVSAVLVERLGAQPEVLVRGGVTHLRVRFGNGPARVVVLCHQDTVWPVGTVDRLPFGIDEAGILRGPGSFDMLTGLVMAIHAIAAVRDVAGVTAIEDVSLLVTGDEEVGSVSSRELILAEAAGARAVLVPEASADGGALKVARKGVSMYRVEARGHAAHAGLEPEKGINAGLELAAQLPLIAALGDASAGTTVTPTTLAGGTTSNTVPSSAHVDVDVRATAAAELIRVDAAIRALRPVTPGADVVVTGGLNRPPLERSASAALYDRYAELAAMLRLPVPEGVAVGGGSDGNFTGGAGIPTLDGLGAVGGGAHAEHEHVVVAEIAPRTTVLAALILTIRR